MGKIRERERMHVKNGASAAPSKEKATDSSMISSSCKTFELTETDKS